MTDEEKQERLAQLMAEAEEAEKREKLGNLTLKNSSGEPPLVPTCPKCGERPARLATMPFQPNPGMDAIAFCCANPACGMIYNVQILGIQQPMVQPAPKGLIIT